MTVMKTGSNSSLRALLFGDVIGKPGCRALFSMAKSLKKEYHADLVLANGENAHEGSGMTAEIINDFFQAGVDVITSGNHIWRNRAIYPLLENENRLLRPENYPKGVLGKGVCTLTIGESKVNIINLEGNLNHSRLRCPFITGKETALKLRKESPITLVDFHAENPMEKEALAIYLDGTVSLVFGTHTHVQTADERILTGGTGYITDIGMTGPQESVIGMSPKIAMDRALTQMPLKLEVEDKPAVVMGIVVEIDRQTGKTLSIFRFQHISSV